LLLKLRYADKLEVNTPKVLPPKSARIYGGERRLLSFSPLEIPQIIGSGEAVVRFEQMQERIEND